MKKNFFFKVFLFTVLATLVTFSACKDYDDDINHLQDQITSLKATVDQINAAVQSGKVIESVSPTDNGIAIVVGGQTYNITNGKDGANGSNGKDGSVITIGENGNWYIDGVDSELAARGPKGETGAPGKDGVDGTDGKDGVYYYPNEDGFWYMVEGENETKTEMTWLPTGTVTAVWADGVVTLHNVEGHDGPLSFGAITLNNLVLIPDYVADWGGALPVMNFAPLITEECGQIAPAVLVRYQVSPSNATESMIDKDNLRFKSNFPKVLTRAIDLNANAEFVSLNNGVLTVRAFIDTEALDDLDSNQIAQIMLVVPTTSGNEVNSDWAKIETDELWNSDLALVRIPAIEDEDINWSEYQFAETLAAAKGLATTNETVVNLAYDETLDLLEVVKTMMTSGAWSNFNIDTYNLEYAFDLKDLDGETIVYELGSNNTDQQKFLNLVGSEISTRVYDLDGPNPAAQDRTPIVHVMLRSKDGALTCNVLDGFIKINIVEAKVEPVPPVTIPVEGNVEAGCENFTLRIGTKQMNEEFYAKAKVSKTFFHEYYKWSQETAGVGTITQEVDPLDTQSYNLLWTVTSAELAANLDKTITKSGMYKYGNNEIKVTFTATVTQPSVDLGALTIDNYWYNNNSFVKFNTTVPTSTTDANPANNTFATNINNVFKTISNTDLRLDLPAGHTYEYFFDKASSQPVKTYNGITISVSTNMKQLLATRGGTTETVATIEPQTMAGGDVLTYNENSDLAKELLNAGPEFMQARLYIEVKRVCEDESTIVLKVNGLNNGDAFNVHFLRPVNVEGQSAEAFIDGVDSGKEGSFINLTDVVNLSDWRNYSKNSTDYYFSDNTNYYGFYNVQSISVDTSNIKPIGLKVGGVDLTALPGTIIIGTDIPTPQTPTNFGQLTYRNNGAGLDESFILEVPVTVTYKWGEVDTKVQVEVKKTAAMNSIL